MDNPFSVLTCVTEHSHKEDLLQMADIFCGVVGWSWNAMKSTRPAKQALHDHLCEKMKWGRLGKVTTSKSAKPFNVWRYTPKPKKKEVGASTT
jgi:hypothetical protein